MYTESFYITEPVSNNAFSYQKRLQEGVRQLWVPAIREGVITDVKEGSKVCFQEYDEDGKLRTSKGLESFIRFRIGDTPIMVVDNHNHVFYFWYEALEQGLIQEGATLLHIDQHSDMREAEEPLPSRDLQTVYSYTNTILNVGNFILPAQQDGIISEIVQIRSDQKLQEMRGFTGSNMILDLDLDFFLNQTGDFEQQREIIRYLVDQADVVTIATSPFFMEQAEAISILQKLLQ